MDELAVPLLFEVVVPGLSGEHLGLSSPIPSLKVDQLRLDLSAHDWLYLDTRLSRYRNGWRTPRGEALVKVA
jgi:hypothetical protein